MTFNAFNNFIDIAKNAGITHIIIHFILCDLNNNLIYNGTVNSWKNYTNMERQSLVNKMENYGITLMASFGGEKNFLNIFVEDLVNDLIEWMIINKIYGIDIDIGQLTINDLDNDKKRNSVINYLGSLSQKIKIMGQQLGFYIHISHAVLPEYFNGPKEIYVTNNSFKNIYNTIEQLYGNYIDFYNVKYYDTRRYSTYDNMFVNDDITPGTAVLQLINANQVNPIFFPIPEFKIVTGKPSDPGNTDSTKFIKLYSTNSRDKTTFSGFIKQNNQASSNIKLQKWFSSGGIMIWEYKNFYNGDLDTSNEYNNQIITLFTNFK